MENHSNPPALSPSELAQQAQVLAKDFIAYRLGKNLRPTTSTAATLRRLADQIEEQYPSLLDHLCHKLNISRSTVYATFAEIASEVFDDGVNWGRIVALYAFGGKLALYCERNNMKDLVDSVTDWTGTYVGVHSDWIGSNGGWDGLDMQFNDQHNSSWWKSMFVTTLGLGTLAAFMYSRFHFVGLCYVTLRAEPPSKEEGSANELDFLC